MRALFLAAVAAASAVAATACDAFSAADTDATAGDASVDAGVSPDAAGAAPIARDAFTRTVASGFGNADLGGKWTSSATSCSVADGVGKMNLMPATGAGGTLRDLRVTDLDEQAVVSSQRIADSTISAAYVSLFLRRTDAAQYECTVSVRPGANTSVTLSARIGAAEAQTLARNDDVPLALAAGESLHMRARSFGTNPTKLGCKAWKSTETEPAGWILTATDGTSAVQGPGAPGVGIYLSASSAGAVTLDVDDFLAVPSTDSP